MFKLFKNYRGSLSKVIVISSFGSGLIKVLNLILVLLISVVLARALGPEQFGIYTFGFTIATILSILVKFGLPKLLVRYIPQYETEGSWSKINGIIIWSISISIMVSLLIILIGTGVIYYYNYSNQINEYKYLTLLWSLLLIPIISILTITGSILRGFRSIIKGIIPEKNIRWLLFLLFLVLFFQLYDNMILSYHAMIIHLIAAIIALVISLIWICKLYYYKSDTKVIDINNTKWLRTTTPLLLSGSMNILNNRIDIVILGLLATSADVGIYEVAVKGALVVHFSQEALNLVLAPYFSKLYKNNVEKLKILIKKAVFYNTVISIPIFLSILLFGKYAIETIYGVEYINGYLPLVVISIAHLFNIVVGPIGLLLNMIGYQNKVLKYVSIAVLFNIIFNSLFIPIYGMIGAAIITSLSYAVWKIPLIIWTIKNIKINTTIYTLFARV